MEASLLLEAVVTIGLPSSLVIFFVWISYKREERLASRVTDLEQQLTTTVLIALKDNTEALRNITESMKDTHEKLREIHSNLNDRPCAITSQKILKHLGINHEEK